MRAAIVGTGWYVPDEVIPNAFFDDGEPWYFYDSKGDRVPETDGERRKTNQYKHTFLTADKIATISGVSERRKAAPDEHVHHLIAQAAENALNNAGIDADALDGIIVATISQQTDFPSAANRVQELLKARRAQNSFDIANACAGFPLALQIANGLIQTSRQGVYLVAGAELLTRAVDYEGRDVNANLFGDGAGVAILAPSFDTGILAYAGRSDQKDGKLDYITRDSYGKLRMGEGPSVLKNAVASMRDVTAELLNKVGWAKDDVDYYVFHQANRRIIEGLIRVMDVDPTKVGNNISRYGNMSAATNPVLLAQAREQGHITDGSKVIVASFGAGLVTSGVAVQF
jgi:3-oxoacyl-[acyl-carrier-protein] synthase-3